MPSGSLLGHDVRATVQVLALQAAQVLSDAGRVQPAVHIAPLSIVGMPDDT